MSIYSNNTTSTWQIMQASRRICWIPSACDRFPLPREFVIQLERWFLFHNSLKQCLSSRSASSHPFLARPFFAPLLFPNDFSDARDHCANERTFLSWLRLSLYMAIVSMAIMLSFHLKSLPTNFEKRMAGPAGVVFWALSLACLISGCANYVKTVTKYSRRKALVQSGWKTQVVSTTVRPFVPHVSIESRICS